MSALPFLDFPEGTVLLFKQQTVGRLPTGYPGNYRLCFHRNIASAQEDQHEYR